MHVIGEFGSQQISDLALEVLISDAREFDVVLSIVGKGLDQGVFKGVVLCANGARHLDATLSGRIPHDIRRFA